MVETQQVEARLDPRVLERVADLICGDDYPIYRTAYEIAAFFRAAEWTWAGEVDTGRRAWVIEQLQARRDDSAAVRRVLLRLADPREYLDEPKARDEILNELNGVLALEGLEIIDTASGPELVPRQRSIGRVASSTPVDLEVSLADIVNDPGFGAELTRRLTEARTCWDSAAVTAAVIMLGSVLEGVLYDVAVNRGVAKPGKQYSLHELIAIAKEQRWVAQEVVDYMDVLRLHRNLVHPRKHVKEGYVLDGDTVRIAWNVVVAALNDLAHFPENRDSVYRRLNRTTTRSSARLGRDAH